ncbi:VOC family protein [Algoriphagus machipongonensis]|uniref:Glyoxalase family protein n=1 Tax=Algoriphagus machipongonensis TaxID=388413 RepID=A3HZ35_9BACT|nr:VOC family protein [Algoriphagus machipongonensis]EAZ80521.1 glyoxalase family protein [Algoriphagus machipongonensis]
MNLEHLAIWVSDLEKMKAFYMQFFEMKSGEKYHNPTKNFTSYFLSFESGARIELMHKPAIEESKNRNNSFGFTHIAISTGSKERVISLTKTIKDAGYEVVGEPRLTGDGYFESVILDPEGNAIELTI